MLSHKSEAYRLVVRLRSPCLVPKQLSDPLVSFLHTRYVPLHKEKPTNWNTAYSCVQANPLLSLLENCRSLSKLKQIQAQMTLHGLVSDGFASNRLITLCALSESWNLDYCTDILFRARKPNVFSWNVAIRGYSESETPSVAVLLY
ncbi:hypothetical protein FEM48_Zijuj02G0197200 [Ziziphus jujuba var. spinosa]|uniref:Pentatricopeptide repeat-containing protein n=1 Tax=Ziziphus jujuba var. spinosa TaxID=714518 RepID=A0A978VXL8_ZIZJJ|nr:hypothetical protein FEM48_Zijuj02G0197200 [Ziziphus jujuba var. spinosa]